MNRYGIHYKLPDTPETFGKNDVQNTHSLLGFINGENLEDAFCQMQGEVWSPNGEAVNLIRNLGLNHTSMMIGDVISNPDTGEMWEVAWEGFDEL